MYRLTRRLKKWEGGSKVRSKKFSTSAFRLSPSAFLYLQVDWETFWALNLQTYVAGTLTSELADGSSVIDLVASVRLLIPECGIDKIVRCISNPAYGKDLLLMGSRLLKECNAVIDYRLEHTTLSD